MVGDLVGDPVEAVGGGGEVGLGEGVPGLYGDGFLFFAEGDVAGDGRGIGGGFLEGEGVEGELEVGPVVGGRRILIRGCFRGFGAVFGFDVSNVSGFVVDDAELAGVEVLVDAVDFTFDGEGAGGDGDIVFGEDGLPAVGLGFDLDVGEPFEALAHGVGLDDDGEGWIFSEVVGDGLVEGGVEVRGEFGGVGDGGGFGVFRPGLEDLVDDVAEVAVVHFAAVGFWFLHFENVLEVEAVGAGEVVAEGGDA